MPRDWGGRPVSRLTCGRGEHRRGLQTSRSRLPRWSSFKCTRYRTTDSYHQTTDLVAVQPDLFVLPCREVRVDIVVENSGELFDDLVALERGEQPSIDVDRSLRFFECSWR